MTYDQTQAREKLSATWRLIAEQMINLGYARSDIFETMAAVALSFGADDQDPTVPDKPDSEELPEVRLPRATWDFDLRH